MSLSNKSEQVHIRCSQCGTFNVDCDYCESCGALLSVIKQRELLRKDKVKEMRRLEAEKEPSKVEFQLEKLKNHRFWLIRAVSEIIYVGWVIAMAIGAFIAWLVAIIVA